jgi:alanine-glyoxylate transaminase/serine-glyoxylate transaminase/serine-pyruvate transaminase
LIPGPVEADETVLEAIGEQILPHYGPQWMALFNETTDLLRKLYGTTGDVLMIPGPGSAAIDGAVASLVPRGESVFIPSNGFFGQRFRQIVEASGIHAEGIDMPWGKHIDPEDLCVALKEAIPRAEAAGRPIRAVALVHHETSTGVLNPLESLAAVVKSFDLALIVDAVASFGGVPIAFDDWGIDVCVGVPNKCLAAPPGVALTAISPRAWAMVDANPSKRGWYLDLATWRWYIENWGDWHPYPTTMPTSNIVAVHRAVKNIFEMGVEAFYQTFRKAAAAVRTGMAELGFTLYPELSYAAPVISALNARPDFAIGEMLAYLRDERGLMLSGGLVDLRGKIFRVGHMGPVKAPEVISALLSATRDFLTQKGLD